MPFYASQVLVIDPFREFTETLASDMRLRPPQEFGRLFELVGEGEGEGSITKFDSAIAKFGQRGFQTIVDCLPPANEAFPTNQQPYLFMVAASLSNGALSVIYHLLRHAPEAVPFPISDAHAVGGSGYDDDAQLSKRQMTRKTE